MNETMQLVAAPTAVVASVVLEEPVAAAAPSVAAVAYGDSALVATSAIRPNPSMNPPSSGSFGAGGAVSNSSNGLAAGASNSSNGLGVF